MPPPPPREETLFSVAMDDAVEKQRTTDDADGDFDARTRSATAVSERVVSAARDRGFLSRRSPTLRPLVRSLSSVQLSGGIGGGTRD